MKMTLVSLLPILLALFAVTGVSAQNALAIPDTLGGNEIHLHVQHATHTFYPGFQTQTIGISAEYLGPTLMLRTGQHVSLFVHNDLGGTDTTTMHWHGLHVAPENDGSPWSPIKTGEIWNPQFNILNPAGTFWYHPHPDGSTNKQVTKGAAGMIIIHDDAESALTLPRRYGVDDIPLVLQTKAFNVFKQIPLNSRMDSVPLANGVREAVWTAPAQVIRFRIINGASERAFMLGFSGNLPFSQIATDGGLMAAPVPLTRLRLGPGERAEILVDFSGKTGQTYYLKAFNAELPSNIIGAASVGMGMLTLEGYSGNPINGANFNFLKINVAAPTANPVTTIPQTLVPLTHWNAGEANAQRTITFSPAGGMMGMVNGPFEFNGAGFDMDVYNITIPLNNIEVWTLNNQTMVAHPFHMHDIQFWLLDRDGVPVPANEQGWKDVVLVMPMGTARFITRFTDFVNPVVPYMYHCHILSHEDEGMMGQFRVIDPNAATSDQPDPDGITVFPNPVVNGVCSVKCDQSMVQEIGMFNQMGELIWQKPVSGNLVTFETGEVAMGIYTLKIKTLAGVGIHKIVVRME
jgi:bilirubin oxidase